MYNAQTDEYIHGITPPAFSLALMHVDTVSTSLSDGYFQSDREWFEKHSKRGLLLRRESNGEFDPPCVPQSHPAFHVVLDKPPLFVLIQKIAVGTHLCIPCWRGAAFWNERAGDYGKSHICVPDVKTDAELAALLIEMQRRGGVDGFQVRAWVAAYFATMQTPKQLTATREMVN